MELIFDDETIRLKAGDTITVPPNVWHEAKCTDGGKMLTLFKNGRFNVFLQQLSTMTEDDFSVAQRMKSQAAEFDIY